MNCNNCIFYRGVAGFRAAFCGFEGARKRVPFDKASHCGQYTQRGADCVTRSFCDARTPVDLSIRFFAPRVAAIEREFDGFDEVDEDMKH